MLLSAASKTPTSCVHTPVWGGFVDKARVGVGGAMSTLLRAMAQRLSALSYWRSKPLLWLPSWLTMVCEVPVALSFAHAETVKLWLVLMAGPAVVMAPVVPLKVALPPLSAMGELFQVTPPVVVP